MNSLLAISFLSFVSVRSLWECLLVEWVHIVYAIQSFNCIWGDVILKSPGFCQSFCLMHEHNTSCVIYLSIISKSITCLPKFATSNHLFSPQCRICSLKISTKFFMCHFQVFYFSQNEHFFSKLLCRNYQYYFHIIFDLSLYLCKIIIHGKPYISNFDTWQNVQSLSVN